MADKKIALVTGANKGIGFEICRQLANAGIQVILTARDQEKGETAVNLLRKENPDLAFFKADVANPSEIKSLAAFIQKEYGQLDILINNAGILPDQDNSLKADLDKAKKVLDTNFFGAWNMCQQLLPLLQKSNDGRIINVSSGMGSFDEMGGGYAAYRISKTALNALTVIMGAELSGSKIKVNAICPGWVKTDMGGSGAPRNVSQGADTAVWLATEPNIPTGKFFRDRKIIKF
jgi:NAD(P)-dependent dehydrogenase (short-subunit alcohol dehydrogenase family)